ncbi:MAG: outer membrane lipoprotein carrier protein LolA [Verrucomicrobia bacterium]|nr:outer membrane lipoprotein carrier protein LolA [Verrucomicrobiota bacterium]
MMWLGRINTIFAGLGFLSLACFLTIDSRAEQPLDLAPVEKWLERMKGTKSLEATFVQQKYLRTLRAPLTTTGHLWLQYPDNFRWELGDPPSTIAIRNRDTLTVLKPKKKRAQRISLISENAKDGGQVPTSIHSMSKTFPRSMEELTEHFVILNIEREDKVYELTLKPKDKKLTLVMRRLVFFIDVKKYHLHAFEIQFRDKSRVRTTFTKLIFNPVIPAGLLKPDLGGYKISDRSQ